MAGDYYLQLSPLGVEDAAQLSSMLRSQTENYVRYFQPFGFDEGTIAQLLKRKVRDIFMGMYWQGQLAGFFMLRGWDEGYSVPSYGVVIDEKFGGCGLGKLSLDAALTICRLLKAPRLMLKVHPRNLTAKTLYEKAGFEQTGFDERNGNLIYNFNL